MGDYFRLLSIDISPATKECLDRALHLTAHPTEDEYAMILPRYDGKCPMHTRNGLCSIQAELNEDRAALFRLVDHTAFDRYVAVILKEICKPEDTVHLLAV